MPALETRVHQAVAHQLQCVLWPRSWQRRLLPAHRGYGAEASAIEHLIHLDPVQESLRDAGDLHLAARTDLRALSACSTRCDATAGGS
ncbi:hypothetical protein NDU88_012962 [Pleurodeles waltl]|uniref:Uncharacterized protein n=1 Tax=Pleurodeles waltl TaxID=8319 RepID=A0AAV7R1M5_PLEWA|nr:hypothetical protein NDU88_012962 [Pleurodeles waltl]